MSEIDPGVVATEVADEVSEPDGRSEIGRRRLRKEDARLVTGQTNWTDNIQFPGMVHMAVLRSPMAHARITRLDVSPALQRPGVLAAYTAAARGVGEMGRPCAGPVTENMKQPLPPPLASGEVRYVG